MKNIYFIKIGFFLKKDVPLKNIAEVDLGIVKYFGNFSEYFKNIHDSKNPVNYSVSYPYPKAIQLKTNNSHELIYPKGRMLFVTFKTYDSDFVFEINKLFGNPFSKDFVNINGQIHIQDLFENFLPNAEINKREFKFNPKYKSLSPVVISFNKEEKDGKDLSKTMYYTEKDFMIRKFNAIQKIKNNLIRKIKTYPEIQLKLNHLVEELEKEDFDFIKDLKVINKAPITVNYKNAKIPAAKLLFEIDGNSKAQDLTYVMDCLGAGEKQGLGFGYVIQDKEK